MFSAAIPALTEYMIETEIDTMDAAVIAELRDLLKTLSSPLLNSTETQITEVNITTGNCHIPPESTSSKIYIFIYRIIGLRKMSLLYISLIFP